MNISEHFQKIEISSFIFYSRKKILSYFLFFNIFFIDLKKKILSGFKEFENKLVKFFIGAADTMTRILYFFIVY